MSKLNKYILLSLCVSQGFAATNAGADSDSLEAALIAENAAGGIVNFNQDVSLLSGATPTQVRAVNSDGSFTFLGADITINGNGFTLNGNTNNVRGFFVGGRNSSSTGSVTINDLTFSGCQVRGGRSGLGGGGMGAGGGLFVGKGTIAKVKDCVFQNCTATGGSLLASASSGGGMKGDGAIGANTAPAGGGGFGGNGGAGFTSPGAGGGCSDFLNGNAILTAPGTDFDAGGTAGQSGVGGASPEGNGGFGGGGGGGANNDGGMGGFGGGAGSGLTSNADSDGGFGGGGGYGFIGFFNTGVGGQGGFGAGGAGGDTGNGLGGFGGGNGPGAGAGFGGAIFLEDSAELTIEGSINFTGSSATAGTGLTANTDPLAGFGALGQDIFMMSGSTIIFDISSDVDLQNPIEGNQGNEAPNGFVPTTTGGLTKKGSALLSLTGDNTFTGMTTVEAGELRINSSVVTDIEVESGATLSGNFDVKVDATGGNGGTLTNRGIVCPGVAGTGQINLEGDYIQESSGTLVVDITPTGNVNDKVFLNMGSATLAGTMDVIVNSGNYIAGTTYEVINAPTNGTEFETVLETGGFGQLIDLQVDYSSVVITILNTVLFEGQNIASGPPTDVVNCIRAADIVPSSDFALAVELLGTLNDKQVNEALTSLSAVRYGALEWINARNNSYAADILSQHLFDLCCSPRDCCSCNCNTSAWIAGFGNLMNNHASLDNLRSYKADAGGVLVGIDSCCSPCFYYGAAFGYTRTHLHWRNNGGGGDTDSYYGALYGSWDTQCCLVLDFSVLGGGTYNDLKRNIKYGTSDPDRGITPLSRKARSDFWSYFVTAHLGFRSAWEWCCSTFEPFALVDYHYYTHEKFCEKGAKSLNLIVKDKDQHFIRGEAGLRWFYEWDCGNCCYAPYLGVSWVGEFPIGKSKQPASFIGQTCVINATSYDSSVQLGSPQAGIKWSSCNGASFLIGYKGLYNSDVSINEVEARFEWIF